MSAEQAGELFQWNGRQGGATCPILLLPMAGPDMGLHVGLDDQLAADVTGGRLGGGGGGEEAEVDTLVLAQSARLHEGEAAGGARVLARTRVIFVVQFDDVIVTVER